MHLINAIKDRLIGRKPLTRPFKTWLGIFCLLTLGSIPAYSQTTPPAVLSTLSPTSSDQVLYNSLVPIHESIPDRPLILEDYTLLLHTGLIWDISDKFFLENWFIPLNAAMPIGPGIEMGLHLFAQVKPWTSQQTINTARLYGRYLLMPNTLALETALYIPTASSNQLGLEILTPSRFTYGPLQVFSHLKIAYHKNAQLETVLLGAAATALTPLKNNFFACGDIGFHLQSTSLNIDPLEGTNVNRNSNNRVDHDWLMPVMVGGGYKIAQNWFVKAQVGFNDFLDNSDGFQGFKNRTFQIGLVKFLDFPDRDCKACQEELSGVDSPP